MKEKKIETMEEMQEEFISPLKKETITVKFIPRPGKINDPKHVLYGGKAESAVTTYTVPRLSSGVYRNPLTNDEKRFLETYMNLQPGQLSVYGHYWDNYFVRVPKTGLTLNLNDPNDYIRYKVLLLNDGRIAPNVETLERSPKHTYEFVLASDNAEVTLAKTKMQYKKDCYKWLGKNEDDFDLMKTILEILENRRVSPNSKLNFIQVQIGELIEKDAEKFIKTATNPMINTQVLINKGITSGVIAKQGNFYYLKNDKNRTPLCEDGEDPDLKTACRYLNNPKNQEIKFMIEATIN